jgi:hypothetical protein
MSTSSYDQEFLRTRLAKLSGGVARIYVGGQTETEIKHKKVLVENALHSVKACLSPRVEKDTEKDKVLKAMMKLLDFQVCKTCKVMYKDSESNCDNSEHAEYYDLNREFLRLGIV